MAGAWSAAVVSTGGGTITLPYIRSIGKLNVACGFPRTVIQFVSWKNIFGHQSWNFGCRLYLVTCRKFLKVYFSLRIWGTTKFCQQYIPYFLWRCWYVRCWPANFLNVMSRLFDLIIHKGLGRFLSGWGVLVGGNRFDFKKFVTAPFDANYAAARFFVVGSSASSQIRRNLLTFPLQYRKIPEHLSLLFNLHVSLRNSCYTICLGFYAMPSRISFLRSHQFFCCQLACKCYDAKAACGIKYSFEKHCDVWRIL